jgi:hypothetical protein
MSIIRRQIFQQPGSDERFDCKSGDELFTLSAMKIEKAGRNPPLKSMLITPANADRSASV